MDSRFEVSDAVRELDPDRIDLDRFGWRAALLGAAVGVGGQTYGGTLLANSSIWIMLAQGRSVKEAYAQLYSFAPSPYLALSLVLLALVLVLSGHVAASLARSRPYLHGLVAGLMTSSFYVVMTVNPSGMVIPAWYGWMSLTLPIAAGLAGAHLYARKHAGGPRP